MDHPQDGQQHPRKLCESCGIFPAVYVSAAGSVCWVCFRLYTRVGFGDQRVTV